MAYTPHIVESGLPDGHALVFFHGFPGSHTQSAVFTPWLKKFNLRILSVDRPGYGFSEPIPNGDLKPFLQGLELALDQRKVERFFVVGVSGGNPAAVCAAGHFGNRVLALGSVCGLAPFAAAPQYYSVAQRNGLTAAKHLPQFALRAFIDQMLAKFTPEQALETMASRFAPVDQEALKLPHVRASLLESMELARRQRSAGILFDIKSFIQPWPVEMARITSPYLLWHGERDQLLSPDMSRYMQAQVPHSRLRLFAEEGHYSLPVMRSEEILSELTAAT